MHKLIAKSASEIGRVNKPLHVRPISRKASAFLKIAKKYLIQQKGLG
jgi:hypothetical protein